MLRKIQEMLGGHAEGQAPLQDRSPANLDLIQQQLNQVIVHMLSDTLR